MGQTLNSSLCVAFKERHSVFLFFFQKHMPMAVSRCLDQPPHRDEGSLFPPLTRPYMFIKRKSDSSVDCQILASVPVFSLLWQVKFTFAPPSVSTKRQGSKYSYEQVLLLDSEAWGWRMFA